MRRGIRFLIVAVVAIATNLGLHAAFGWCGKGYWNNCGNGYYQGCGPNQGYWNNGSGSSNGCANPWGCTPNDGSGGVSKDTIQ